MKTKTKFEVIVGNIGTVYVGSSKKEAKDNYTHYKQLSREGVGRAAGESVTLMEDGEPIREHHKLIMKNTDKAKNEYEATRRRWRRDFVNELHELKLLDRETMDQVAENFGCVRYMAELTDLFGGEANYAWVNRSTFFVLEGDTTNSVIRLAKKAVGLEGPHETIDYGDMIEVRPKGRCMVLFITFVEKCE